MPDFFFQIFRFVLGRASGLAVPLFPRSGQKWAAGILAVLLIAISLGWAGSELAVGGFTPSVSVGIVPDTLTFAHANIPPNSLTGSPPMSEMSTAAISSTTVISPIGVIGYTTLFTTTLVVYTYPLPVPLYSPPSMDRIVIQQDKQVVVWPFDPSLPIYVNGQPVFKATRMSGTFVITSSYSGSGGIATLTPLESVSVTVESFLESVLISDQIPATDGAGNGVWAILIVIAGLALSILIWRNGPKFHLTRK